VRGANATSNNHHEAEMAFSRQCMHHASNIPAVLHQASPIYPPAFSYPFRFPHCFPLSSPSFPPSCFPCCHPLRPAVGCYFMPSMHDSIRTQPMRPRSRSIDSFLPLNHPDMCSLASITLSFVAGSWCGYNNSGDVDRVASLNSCVGRIHSSCALFPNRFFRSCDHSRSGNGHTTSQLSISFRSGSHCMKGGGGMELISSIYH